MQYYISVNKESVRAANGHPLWFHWMEPKKEKISNNDKEKRKQKRVK